MEQGAIEAVLVHQDVDPTSRQGQSRVVPLLSGR